MHLEDCQVKIRVISNPDYSSISRSNGGDNDSPISISAHHSDDSLMRLSVDCMVKTTGKTGVEMEAMVGASAAALCIYDMVRTTHNTHGMNATNGITAPPFYCMLFS
jgi:hypothetical protein